MPRNCGAGPEKGKNQSCSWSGLTPLPTRKQSLRMPILLYSRQDINRGTSLFTTRMALAFSSKCQVDPQLPLSMVDSNQSPQLMKQTRTADLSLCQVPLQQQLRILQSLLWAPVYLGSVLDTPLKLMTIWCKQSLNRLQKLILWVYT